MNLCKRMLPFLLASLAATAEADVVVIVSAKSPVASLTKEQVSDIFLAKATTFPGGGAATPVEQVEGAAPRDEFHSKVTGKAGAQLKAYWSKLVFTGKASAPKELPDSAEVKKLVAGDPGLVGYIDKSAVDGSVKVVLSP
jgi:ABC-type phosphate transport system substrate-binding protein